MNIEYKDRKFEIQKDDQFFYLLEIEPPCNDRKLLFKASGLFDIMISFCYIIGEFQND